MKPAHKIVSIVLVVLLGATVYGLVRTRRQTSLLGKGTSAETTPEQAAVVDQTPLFTAQRLARMPTSATELPFAQEALRWGDQGWDLGLAVAGRAATGPPPVLTAEAKEIQARLQK